MAAAFAVLVLPKDASAHRFGERYIYLEIGQRTVSGRFEVMLDHLTAVFDRQDAPITKDSFAEISDDTYRLFSESLSLEYAGTSYPVTVTSHEFLDVGFATFAVLAFTTELDTPLSDSISARHVPVFEEQAARAGISVPTFLLVASNVHSGLQQNEARHAFSVGAREDRYTIPLKGTPSGQVVSAFSKLGASVLLRRADLLALILVLALPFAARSATPAQNGFTRWFRSALAQVLLIAVIAAALHAAALLIALFAGLALPRQAVVLLVAAGVFGVAIGNVARWAMGSAALITLACAIAVVHGLGFAKVLTNYGLEQVNFVLSFVSLHLGLALAIAASAAGLLCLLRPLTAWSGYANFILRGGSALIGLVAMHWIIERAFGIDIGLKGVFV